MEFFGFMGYMLACGALAMAGLALARTGKLEDEMKQLKAKVDFKA